MGIIENLMNMIRKQKDRIEEATKDSTLEGKYAIEDSKKKVVEFRAKVVDLNAKVKELDVKIREQEGVVAKYGKMAEKALTQSNEEGARQCLVEQNKAETELATLKQTRDQNQAEIEKNRNLLNEMNTAIQRAEMNYRRLTVNMESAKVRQDLAKASSSMMGEGSPLAALGNLEKAVKEEEAKAAAIEEEVGLEPGNVLKDLEKQFGDDNASASVDDKLAQMKAKMQTTTTV